MYRSMPDKRLFRSDNFIAFMKDFAAAAFPILWG